MTLTWTILRLVWEARGYSMKEIPPLLKKEWPSRKGIGFSSVQRNADLGRTAPDDIAAFILALPVREGHQDRVDVVRQGLEAITRGGIDPEALAVSIAAKLPQVDPEVIARAIASALMAQVEQPSGTGLIDAIVRAIASRLPKLKEVKLARRLARRIALAGRADAEKLEVVRELLSRTDAKLDRANATLAAADFKLDVLHGKVDQANAKLDSSNRQLDRNTRAIWGLALVTAALLLVNCLRSVQAPPLTPNFFARFLGEQEVPQMGEKQPAEHSIPTEPPPGSKRPPCATQAGEEAINGACYQWTGVKPPCGPMLLRSGERCYRGIWADPEKPRSLGPSWPPSRR